MACRLSNLLAEGKLAETVHCYNACVVHMLNKCLPRKHKDIKSQSAHLDGKVCVHMYAMSTAGELPKEKL